MATKISDALTKLLKSDKKIKVFVLLGVLGIGLIVLSDVIPAKSEKQTDSSSDQNYSDYIEATEKRTENIISSIDGVGKCKVMITISDTNESVYAKNKEESGGNGNYSNTDEYVLYDGADGDTPVLIKQYFPKIQGVVVVCDGGDNKVVREKIIAGISSLFDVPANKITVSKIKG